jgi:GNAT superfamily N-acetyltransferase
MARQVGGEGSTSEVPLPIRFAAEGDLTGILEIERLSFPDGKQWDSGDFQAALKDLFFVFLDGEISGFLIAVHPDCRNRGIATRLIEAAIGKFRDMGIREVELDVEIVKRGAIQLYERVGFRTARGIPMSENETMNNENGSFYMMKMVIGER